MNAGDGEIKTSSSVKIWNYDKIKLVDSYSIDFRTKHLYLPVDCMPEKLAVRSERVMFMKQRNVNRLLSRVIIKFSCKDRVLAFT